MKQKFQIGDIAYYIETDKFSIKCFDGNVDAIYKAVNNGEKILIKFDGITVNQDYCEKTFEEAKQNLINRITALECQDLPF